MVDPGQNRNETAVEANAVAAEAFYSGALGRISRCMLWIGALFSLAAWLRYGWQIALGFVFGCALAHLNFYWLERVVGGLADRVTADQRPRSGAGIVVRFLLRYLLMAVGAYAIFTVSRASLYGLFAGLFLPVAGIGCEAVYELYAAVTRGW